MLIISAGMQKSGSGYLYNLINDLEIAAGKNDARAIKRRWRLEQVMQQHNNNIGPLHLAKLLHLWAISLKEGDFTVKTHASPALGVKVLNALGLVKIVYCYRDPRDVLLSAMDHGQKSRAQGIQDNFSHLTEFDAALRHVKGWVDVWKQYQAMAGVLLVKYEEVMGAPLAAMDTIQGFLGISLQPATIQDILWKYSKDNRDGDRTGLHLNKAVSARYIKEMTAEHKNRFLEEFSADLLLMGYPADQDGQGGTPTARS